MKTRIIIPARNEAHIIADTLRALPTILQPVVAVNGSQDDTAKIARSFGAEVYEYDKPGKDAAFRQTLHKLGERALEPLLATDADALPLFPKAWAEVMLKPLNEYQLDYAIAVVGLLGARNKSSRLPSSPSSLARTVRRVIQQQKLAKLGKYYPCGANVGFRFTRETLDEILDNPLLYWPGEDRYYLDVVRRKGRVRQLTDPRTIVLASDRYMPKLSSRLRRGARRSEQEVFERYLERVKGQNVVDYTAGNRSIG